MCGVKKSCHIFYCINRKCVFVIYFSYFFNLFTNRKEINGIRGTLFIRGTLLSFNIISRFSIFISLVTYVYFGNVFTARKVFIVTSYFNFLYSSVLHFWPLAITSVAETFVSIKRIQDFLTLPETKQDMYNSYDNDNELEKLLRKTMSKKKLKQINTRKLRDYKENGGAVVIKEQLVENRILGERTFNDDGDKKGIVFKNGTARWLQEAKGSNIGKNINNISYLINCVLHYFSHFISLSIYIYNI